MQAYVLELGSLQGADLQVLTPIEGKSAVEVAADRGPAFGSTAARLLLRACHKSNLAIELQKLLKKSAFIDDHTVSLSCMCVNLYISHDSNVICLQYVSMLIYPALREQLRKQKDEKLEDCIVEAIVRGFALTAVEIAKISTHPLEEKILIVFDHAADYYEKRKVVSSFQVFFRYRLKFLL